MEFTMRRLIILIFFFCHVGFAASPIKVGVLRFAPPFSVQTGPHGQYYGFIIDLMDNICQRIKQECVYVGTPLVNQYDLLNEGKIDVAFAVNPIVEEDVGPYVFSLPYLTSNVQFFTLNDSPIHTINEIKNKRIGVLKLTLYDLIRESKYSHYGELKEYEKVSDLLNALMQHKIDVGLLNYSSALYLKNNTTKEIRFVGDKISLGNGYGIVALKSKAELIGQINKAILSIQQDGTFIKLYNLYFEQ